MVLLFVSPSRMQEDLLDLAAEENLQRIRKPECEMHAGEGEKLGEMFTQQCV